MTSRESRGLVAGLVLAFVACFTTALRADEDPAAKPYKDIVAKNPGSRIIQGGKDGKEAVGLSFTKMTNDGLKDLKELKNLEILDLRNTGVGDAGMEHLKGLTTLKELYLAGNKDLTSAGMGQLKDLTNLEILDLRNTGVDDKVLKDLKGFTKLKDLSLPEGVTTKVTNELLQALGAGSVHLLPRAKAEGGKQATSSAEVVELDLTGTDVAADGLKSLKGLPKLNKLVLDAGKIDDNVVLALQEVGLLHALDPQAQTAAGDKRPTKASEVAKLDLSKTAVSPKGLAALKDFTELQELTPNGQIASAEGLKALPALPKLKMFEFPGDKVNDRLLTEDLKADGFLVKFNRARKDDKPAEKPDDVTSLNLSGGDVTVAGLQALKDFKNLKVLDLSGTWINDANLKDLRDLAAGFKNLDTLDLTDTAVTPDGKKLLQKKLGDKIKVK